MSEWLLVYNPESRRGMKTFERLRGRITAAAGRLPDVHLRCLALRELDALAAEPERIILAGGDGTINAAAGWMLRSGCRAPLAILPAGTGNNLARGLGIPLHPDAALRLALEGRSLRTIDAARFEALGGGGTSPMVQTSALGFPADVADGYDRLRRNPWLRRLFAPAGPYIYRLLALGRLRAQKRRERRGENLLEVRLEMPEGEVRETALAVFIGNERSLGGNFHPCPRARLDDGKLDICLIRAGTGESYLRLFRKVVRGEHLELEDAVVYRQTAGPVQIRLSAPLPLLIDGDLRLAGDAFRLEVLPSRLAFVAP